MNSLILMFALFAKNPKREYDFHSFAVLRNTIIHSSIHSSLQLSMWMNTTLWWLTIAFSPSKAVVLYSVASHCLLTGRTYKTIPAGFSCTKCSFVFIELIIHTHTRIVHRFYGLRSKVLFRWYWEKAANIFAYTLTILSAFKTNEAFIKLKVLLVVSSNDTLYHTALNYRFKRF